MLDIRYWILAQSELEKALYVLNTPISGIWYPASGIQHPLTTQTTPYSATAASVPYTAGRSAA